MSAHARDQLVGGAALQLELDVGVELLEALVAEHLGPRRAEYAFTVLSLAWSSIVPNSRSNLWGRPFRQARAELAASVVEGLVERAAGRVEALGEHVDRDPVEGQGDEDLALVRGELVLDCLGEVPISSPVSASWSGVEPRSAIAPQCSASIGTSRPCQARRRTLTAASSRANL